MAKDPAFLFYYQDFLVGTSFMTFEEIGAYIKLLCFLADKGTLKESDILKKIPKPIWEAICCKFEKEEGGYFNRRLRAEVTKRRNYTQSRKENLHMDKHMGSHMIVKPKPHMENEDINEDEDAIKDKYEEKVYLKKEEHIKLVEKFGEQDTKNRIEALDLYMRSKGKRYKDHYATILAWYRKDKDNEGNSKKDNRTDRGKALDAIGTEI